MSAAHGPEDDASHRVTGMPSDRNFGLTMAAALLVYSAYAYRHGRHSSLSLGAAVVFAALALFRPRVLHPPNVAWTRLGRLLERIVNPIVLGIVFVIVVTPLALVMRLAGRDPLRRRIDRTATSYWIAREDPPASDSWPRQF